jgi:hypothetical protein
LLIDAELCTVFTSVKIRYSSSFSDGGHLITTKQNTSLEQMPVCTDLIHYYTLQPLRDTLKELVGAAHIKSSAAATMHFGIIIAIIARKHSLLCNDSIIRYPWKQISTTQ